MNLRALIFLISLPTLAVDTISDDSPVRFSDAATAATCKHYNKAAHLHWVRRGGDWVDADGVMHGNKPFAKASVVPGQTQVSVDATLLSNKTGIVVKSVAGSFKFPTREAGKAATLTVGDTVVKVRADATITCSTGQGLGINPSMEADRSGRSAYISFPPVGEGQATLHLQIIGGSGELAFYEMPAPVSEPGEVSGGFAVEYPNDVGIDKDSRVLWHESWDIAVHDWWKRNGDYQRHTLQNDATWPYDLKPCPDEADFCEPGSLSGVFRSGQHNLKVEETGGIKDGNLWIHFPPERLDGRGNGTKTPHGHLLRKHGKEFDEVYYRYYLKLGPDFRDAPRCDGGKFPGFVSEISGGLVHSVTGKNGWSLRGGYDINCDRNNPIYPRVALHTYAYDMSKPDGQFGQTWAWTGRGDLGLVELDRWVCIEQRLKVNTPGKKDGILQVWIDGKLAHERLDVELRGSPPYEPEKAVTLGISEAANHTHHGGGHTAGKWMSVYMDQLVAATERVGCMAEDPQVEPAAE